MKIKNKTGSAPVHIPVLNNLDLTCLGEKMLLLEKAGETRVHIEAGDGHLTPIFGFGPDQLKCLWKINGMDLEVHLLLEKPASFIKPYMHAGADALLLPVEAGPAILPLLQQIRNTHSKREKPMRTGISLFPGSPVSLLEPFLSNVDIVILHSVHPGCERQVLTPEMESRVMSVKRMMKKSGITVELLIEGALNNDRLIDEVTGVEC
jgi:ribulose-phosphate 3-epimerase